MKKMLSYEEMNQVVTDDVSLVINNITVDINPTSQGCYDVLFDGETVMLLDYKYYYDEDKEVFVADEENIAEVLERVCDDGDLWLKEQLSVYYQAKSDMYKETLKEPKNMSIEMFNKTYFGDNKQILADIKIYDFVINNWDIYDKKWQYDADFVKIFRKAESNLNELINDNNRKSEQDQELEKEQEIS